VRSAVLQQAVGEPARGRARVQAHAVGWVEPELPERVLQLPASTRDELRALGDLDGDILGDHLPGFLGTPPLPSQAHVTCQHGGRRARARIEQAPLGQNGV
jgi:hypothetical protein